MYVSKAETKSFSLTYLLSLVDLRTKTKPWNRGCPSYA